MALRLDHTWENPELNRPSKLPFQIVEGFKCSMNSVHDVNSPEHYAENYLVRNLDCLSGLVLTTQHEGKILIDKQHKV
jgi:hypothetical protein